jgi:lysozyme
MRQFERDVLKLVKVPLEQREFDALVSFAFNCGSGNLAKSTLLKKINAGDKDGAASEFLKWDRAGGKVLRGLTRRRNAERALFSGGDWEAWAT